jgi:hypothetical protein
VGRVLLHPVGAAWEEFYSLSRASELDGMSLTLCGSRDEWVSAEFQAARMWHPADSLAIPGKSFQHVGGFFADLFGLDLPALAVVKL